MTDAPDPIQEAVAWLRLKATTKQEFRTQDTRDKMSRWADAIEAQGKEIERLREALEPFATLGQSDYGDIRDGLMRDRICDWFGPSDFNAARVAMQTTFKPAEPNPSEVQGSADRDAAEAATHLPASAPPLGSPAPQPAGLYSEARGVHLREALRNIVSAIDAGVTPEVFAKVERERPAYSALRYARIALAQIDGAVKC